jgi:hypothetical protein
MELTMVKIDVYRHTHTLTHTHPHYRYIHTALAHTRVMPPLIDECFFARNFPAHKKP